MGTATHTLASSLDEESIPLCSMPLPLRRELTEPLVRKRSLTQRNSKERDRRQAVFSERDRKPLAVKNV